MPRALLSVTDKTGLADFAAGLVEVGYELISTGGTLRHLRDAGLPALGIEEVTGFPEMLDGRVKTLHPKVHGGLLGRTDLPEHAAAMAEHDIQPIDLVCVNLYRFEEAAAKGLPEAETVEQIDIGGPSMLRSAAKNYERVAVVTDAEQYDDVLAKLKAGGLSVDDRRILAASAFATTAAYDAAIAGWFVEQTADADADEEAGETADDAAFPARLSPSFEKRTDLPYGENPHQRAAFFVEPHPGPETLAAAEQLHGKGLSYNNLLDLDAARALIREFDAPACAVLKHTNPCGCAEHEDPVTAFQRAYAGDPVSAFGSIIAVNRPVTAALAEAICETAGFVEALLAPGFDDDALDLLTSRPVWKKNVRLMSLPGLLDAAPVTTDLRRVSGGLLVQDRDEAAVDPAEWECKTDRQPTAAERADLIFAQRVVKHLKSNAICYVKDRQLVGAGAGQMSRLDSAKIAAEKADGRAAGGACGSDAFFPFRDGVDAAAAAGVTAIVQPGGSKRDDEAIAAANEHGLAMLFTGRRHFRH
ncbi:bifunctional phosphoribosylaminoimidazolecarboxamide formyltransferase/IMP cyclohydrolase [Alienimonas californiensis]|uniref:Bifunctional purine biosynthesis protein PurH n=1 Tax=Alienimonas californiensis TaxID=2527989 RepID=A0A517P4R1_9PLAN|nr:bifunctional phosphoribosylaminoimidazolecarboxamide formyltransferase/IMP cyclohydrolase [Alienimonas californiensis]QDT14363.1 Bifunctional purine biosynthesis protein PurH [Alienimonas californiensis]